MKLLSEVLRTSMLQMLAFGLLMFALGVFEGASHSWLGQELLLRDWLGYFLAFYFAAPVMSWLLSKSGTIIR